MIEELKNSDEQVFNQLYRLWVNKIYHYFFKKVKLDFVANELTQLTFIKFWEYRHSLTSTLPVDVQLYYKARLVFIDWLRREATQRKIFTELVPESEHRYASPENMPSDISVKVNEAIEKLPNMCKKVFKLSYMDGYTYKEIADLLNISPKTVDNHIYQALKKLRKTLSVVIFWIWFLW